MASGAAEAEVTEGKPAKAAPLFEPEKDKQEELINKIRHKQRHEKTMKLKETNLCH